MPRPEKPLFRPLVACALIVSAAGSTVAVAHQNDTEAPAAAATAHPESDVTERALAIATRTRALPLRDGEIADPGRYCDPADMRVSWSEPEGTYRNGAFIEPLGPAPAAGTAAVNGVVLCEGSNYAYMGFEAVRTDDGWEIYPVPSFGDDHADEPDDEHTDHADEEEAEPAENTDDAKGSGSNGGASKGGGAGGPVPTGLRSLKASSFTSSIEPYAAYVGQTVCDPTAKPGVLAFRTMLLKTFPGSRNLGITRACGNGIPGEHKEGRAFDWGVRADRPREMAQAQKVLDWLFATDEFGNDHAMARRLGVMYIVWNRKIWGAYRVGEGWRPYRGASPHTDHIHFSFAWAGALRKTSFWSGTVADMPGSSRGASGRQWQNVSYGGGDSTAGGSGGDHDGDDAERAQRREERKRRYQEWRERQEAQSEAAREAWEQWKAERERRREQRERLREQWRLEREERRRAWEQQKAQQQDDDDADEGDDGEELTEEERAMREQKWREARERREEWRRQREQRRREWREQREQRRREWREHNEQRRGQWREQREQRRREWRERREQRRRDWRERRRQWRADRDD